jgi:hypothetical protein
MQNDSGININIFGGGSFGYFEKNNLYEYASNTGYREIAV